MCSTTQWPYKPPFFVVIILARGRCISGKTNTRRVLLRGAKTQPLRSDFDDVDADSAKRRINQARGVSGEGVVIRRKRKYFPHYLAAARLRDA